MKRVRKWNYEKHDYELYIIPDGWEVCLYTEDMDKIVNCVQCGKEIKYGNTYTSQEVHTHLGLGYHVCEDCHIVELERKIGAKVNDK